MMLTPSTWTVIPTVEGALLDTPQGRIVHVERARPLVRVVDFVRSRLATRPELTLKTLEPMITDESEYAAIVTAEHTDTRIAWGVIFGDDFYAWYESDAGSVAEVTALTRAHRLGLGERWRQFRYAPPSHWDALARGLVTDWLVPGFPARWGVMTVYPAFPASATTASVIPMLLANAAAHGFVASARPELIELASAHGLPGVWTDVEGMFNGVPTQRSIAAFLDGRFVYSLELQVRTPAIWKESREAFSRVCRSVEPLPSPRASFPWVD